MICVNCHEKSMNFIILLGTVVEIFNILPVTIHVQNRSNNNTVSHA